MTSAEIALLPCPFCGGPAQAMANERVTSVGCNACAMWFHSQNDHAYSAWNRRALSPPADAMAVAERVREACAKVCDDYAIYLLREVGGKGPTVAEQKQAAVTMALERKIRSLDLAAIVRGKG